MNLVKSTLGHHILADGLDLVMDMEKSEGSWLVDKNTGDRYLDMFTMFASGSVGYNHPYIVEKSEWLGKMAVNKPTMSDVYNEEYAEFMRVFERVAIPENLEYAFFISGGALAVENALKVAFDWKTRLNKENGGSGAEADKVIHFRQAFHGRSGYTLSMTNTYDPRKYMYFPKFDWPRITNPKIHFPETEASLQKTIELEAQARQEIESAIKKYGDSIACLCIETLQGEGGDNYFRKEFHQYLREITEKNDILLIYDEVQCGMGITGKMWAYENYGVEPDIIAFGKKTQVCGILANKRKMNRVAQNVFHESSRINSTFGGNFIDFCRFKLILEIIENENLLENVKVQGAYLLNQLQEMQSEHAEKIDNVRAMGLWAAFDFKNAEDRPQFMKNAYANKLLILSCGERSIRFRPNLNVNQRDLDEAIYRIKKSF